MRSAEHCGCGLLIEIELRHRLVVDQFDLCLQVVSDDYSRIRQELSVGVLIQGGNGRRKLRNRQNCEPPRNQVAESAEEIVDARISKRKSSGRRTSL